MIGRIIVMSTGWVCVHRKMLEWEWFDDHNVFRLFMYLLLSANHKQNKWKGITVKKGSLITGRDALALKTGLSVRQVRTALSKLKSTNDIAIKSTSKYSIVSITNWDLYQSKDQLSDQPATNERPTNDQPATTNNNDNNVNNVNNVNKEKWPFSDFYTKYPVKKSKAVAEKKWKLLGNEKRELAIDGIEKYKASVPEGISFVHPSTYLSQERWTDEVTTQKPSNQQAANQPVSAARFKRI